MLSGLVRRSVPRASAVNIDWNSVVNKCVADESKSFVLGLKQDIAVTEAMHDKYSAVPPPIDWAAYKDFFENNPQIAKLQTQYEGAKAVVVPPIETAATMSLSSASPVSDPKDIDWEGSWKSYRDLFGKPSAVAAKQAANTEAKVATLTEREVVLKANRTTDQTTVADVFKKYPSIEQEVNDEVANHEWCTNIK